MVEETVCHDDPIVIDLGKRKRKSIKNLRKGKGALLDKVGDCINELKTAKQISSDAQVVIVVVKEKENCPRLFR